MTSPTEAPRTSAGREYAIRCLCGGGMYITTPPAPYPAWVGAHRAQVQRLTAIFWEVHTGREHEPVDADGFAWRSNRWAEAAAPASPDTVARALAEVLNPYLDFHPLPVQPASHRQWRKLASELIAALPAAAPAPLDVTRLALALHEEWMDRWGNCGDTNESYDDHMTFHQTRANRIAAAYAVTPPTDEIQEEGA